GRRRPATGARAAHAGAEDACADERRRESGRQLLRRGLVWLRRAGPAHAARRQAGVLDPVLRQRRPQRLLGLALAIARRRRQRPGGRARVGSVDLAGRRNLGAHPLLGLHPRHDALDESPDLPAGRGLPLASLAFASVGRKKYLFTPGPTPVPPQVLAALAEPVVHHRSPDFKPIYERCLARLREVCRTERDVLLFAASGTGAFEAAVANLVSPGDPHLVVSASQKALMTPPGLGLCAVSDAARGATGTSPRFYFDWERTRKAQAKLDAAFTPPVSLVAGLDVALGLLLEEGLEVAFDRHVRLGRAARAGVKAMGLELFSPD